MIETAPTPVAVLIPEGSHPVHSPVAGNVWQLKARPGQQVAVGDELLVLEAMKMEISVRAETAGTVTTVACTEGRPVNAGDVLIAIMSSKEIH